MKESERIQKELNNLAPEFAEDGIVKTVLRDRIQGEKEKEMKPMTNKEFIESVGKMSALELLSLIQDRSDYLTDRYYWDFRKAINNRIKELIDQ